MARLPQTVRCAPPSTTCRSFQRLWEFVGTHTATAVPMSGRFRAYLVLVRATGPFWLDLSSFNDFGTLTSLTPVVCTEFFTCVVDGGDCAEFERVAAAIVDNHLIPAHRATTRSSFPDLGTPSAAGSVSQTAKALLDFSTLRPTSSDTSDSNHTPWIRTDRGKAVVAVLIILVAIAIAGGIVVQCRKGKQHMSEKNKVCPTETPTVATKTGAVHSETGAVAI
eukprot:m.340282 g.340282  ORF g.340282 m.340282 type:complete len:222 (+) comp27825_c1_seq12:2113-2778(+)